ncbi:MAG: transposase [Ignavibacteriaceae bacterium]
MKYVNFKGSFLFLILIIDGYSRFIVHHELRKNMEEYDVKLTLQKALELFPGYKPRVISDNGSQFISIENPNLRRKDFAQFIKATGLAHIRTSVAYPQSNGKLERFNRTVSEQLIKKSSLINLDVAKQQFIKYICHYNTVRLRGSLFYLTPEDFLLNRINRKLEIRQN